MSRVPLYGIFTECDGIAVRRNSVHVLVSSPIEFEGDGVHRLALRMLYGEWNFLTVGPVPDLISPITTSAHIESVRSNWVSSASSLGRAVRWQPPVAYWMIEADRGTWILRSALFHSLVFTPLKRFHLSIGGYDFELTPRPGEFLSMKAQLLTDLPVARPTAAKDRLGFTRWSKREYSAPLVRDRFEFADVRLLPSGSADSALADSGSMVLRVGARGDRPPSPPGLAP